MKRTLGLSFRVPNCWKSLLSAVSLFSCALLATVLALCGCNSSVSIGNPKAYAQDFFDRSSGKGKYTIIDCGAFVEKKFDGKTYEVAKVNVSGKNGFGSEVQNVMGIVEDEAASMVYSLPLDDFDKFLASGDTSVFPKLVDLTVK
jgi:hypothetical protein